MLELPDFSKPFILEIDASSKVNEDVDIQQGQPLAYMSQVLGQRNQARLVYEK